MARDRIRISDLESQSVRQQDNSTSTAAQQAGAEHLPPVATGLVAAGLTSRQSAVMRMQQTQGNAAVRRMLVQRAPAGEDGGPIDADVTQQINSARGGGQALDTHVAEKLGGAMGSDFSDVKVHTDASADTLNRQLSAKAFTTGSDIFFQQGAYQPSSGSGQELLAHELTHVVQQSGSSPSGSLTLGPANDSYEQEADSVAHEALSSTTQPTAQRDCEDCGDDVQRMADVQRADEEDEMEADGS